MKIKNADIKIKAGPDDGLADGQFEAYASVFGNVDSYGDVVVKGAFADTLAAWKESGNKLPALFGHRFDDPDYNIGHVEEAIEDDRGLKVRVQLDLESPKAMQTYRLLKGRRISQMSYAYDVVEGSPAKSEELGDYFELRKLKLHEVSVVPIGANQETEVLGVKALTDAITAGMKQGRVLAAKHIDSLRTAQEAIGAVIKAADGDDQEKANDQLEAKPGASDEERSAAKSHAPREEPLPGPSVDDLARKYNYDAIEYGEKGVEL